MKAGLKNALLISGTFLVPIVLGALIVGPAPPSGRNSESPTRVGHRAAFALLEALGYEVRRFERGLESLPEEPSVLVALEPGPSLLRDSGRYAGPLARWLGRGHAALLTLGPDPDHAAEVDDRDQLFGESAKRAIAYAKAIERNARARARRGEGADRSPATPGDSEIDARVPDDPREERIEAWDSWDARHLAGFIGTTIVDGRLTELDRARTATLGGALAEAIGAPSTIVLTRPRTFRVLGKRSTTISGTDFSEPKVLVYAGREPLLLELGIGAGRLLLLSEPRLFQNGAIDRGAHARLFVRAIERIAEQAHTRRVYFEEFSHGAREADNVIDLALGPRARWVTLQILVIGLAWIALAAFRRRSVVPREVPPRRSRHEVIDAMASLYLRSGDTRGAWRRLVLLSRRRLARALGLSAQSTGTEELARAVASRAGEREAEALRACLSSDGVGPTRQFVERAKQLRRLRVGMDEQRGE